MHSTTSGPEGDPDRLPEQPSPRTSGLIIINEPPAHAALRFPRSTGTSGMGSVIVVWFGVEGPKVAWLCIPMLEWRRFGLYQQVRLMPCELPCCPTDSPITPVFWELQVALRRNHGKRNAR